MTDTSEIDFMKIQRLIMVYNRYVPLQHLEDLEVLIDALIDYDTIPASRYSDFPGTHYKAQGYANHIRRFAGEDPKEYDSIKYTTVLPKPDRQRNSWILEVDLVRIMVDCGVILKMINPGTNDDSINVEKAHDLILGIRRNIHDMIALIRDAVDSE